MTSTDCIAVIDRYAHSNYGLFKLSFKPPPQGTIIAKRKGMKFQIFSQDPRHIRNSFIPFFVGTVSDLNNGCQIQGRFQLHPFVKRFMTCWFCFVALSILMGILTITFRPADISITEAWFCALIPFVMLAFGVALVRFGSWFSREDTIELERFLEVELKSTRADGNPNPNKANVPTSLNAGAPVGTQSETALF